MDFRDLNDIIDFAISEEIKAAEFYRSISEREDQKDKKLLFLQFAEEEEKHHRLLKNLKSGDVGDVLEKYPFTWITDIKRSNYIADISYSPGMPYRDILMLAAQREEKALALYNLLLAKAEDETSRKIFKVLCQEEAKHKLTLEGTLDAYMAEMGD
jgi:rubrerythrin